MRNDARANTPAAWVSISAYARTYGLSRNTVYKLLDHQQLETYRVLSVVRIKNISPDRHVRDDQAEITESP